MENKLCHKEVKIGDMIFFEGENLPAIVTGSTSKCYKSHRKRIEKASVTKVNRKQPDGSWKLYHVTKEEE